MPSETCPSYEGCSAPLCPLDKNSLKNGLWFPDEPICSNLSERTDWIRKQRRVARKAKDTTRYFTFRDLSKMQRISKPRGHNPDTVVA